MITNKLTYLKELKGENPLVDQAIKFIESTNLNELTEGKHEINKQMFAVKSSYETKSENIALSEAHRKYIDLQIILEGEEVIFGGDIDDYKETTSYDDKKDVAFYKGEASWKIICKKDTFAIFYPYDIHQPGVTLETAKKITKVVFKIHVI
ncbi:MAG: YhcH/YjgK/YiaL family protein [Clostridiales bacterium]|nr:YhcH/YjgK/YiaL family protein [Clostridiales bacterium]